MCVRVYVCGNSVRLHGFWMQEQGWVGVWAWHFDCSLNTQCPLFTFSVMLFYFFPLWRNLLRPLFMLKSFPTLSYVSTLFLFCVFWCRGTAEQGRNRWSWGWSCVTMVSCITVQQFSLLRISTDQKKKFWSCCSQSMEFSLSLTNEN